MGRSEERHSFFRGDYTVHFDDDGNEIGTSEERHSICGDYTQHFDAEGDKAGTSEDRHSICGDYTQHFDGDGDRAGTSEDRHSICGDFTQHFDAEGDKAGRSEHRSTFLGGDRTEHDGRFSGLPLASSGDSDDADSETGVGITTEHVRESSSDMADSSADCDIHDPAPARTTRTYRPGGDAGPTPPLDAKTIRLIRQIEGKSDDELDLMMRTYPLPESALVNLVCMRLTANQTYNLATLLMLGGGCSDAVLTYECGRRLRDLGQADPALERRIARARKLGIACLSEFSDTDPELVEWEKREILHETKEAQREKEHEEWKRLNAPPTFWEFLKRGLGFTSEWRK